MRFILNPLTGLFDIGSTGEDLSPKFHTILNELQLNGDSQLSIVGDGILQVRLTLGQHRMALNGNATLEIVG